MTVNGANGTIDSDDRELTVPDLHVHGSRVRNA